MDIQVVLEASAVATVIGAGISYLTFRNSSKLTYITQERKEWRAEIRKITEELEECSYKNRKRVLVKLKTRINAYGKFENRTNNEGNPLKDAHIWDCIQMMEACPKDEYDELRERLVELLSLLLKDDWERAKQEVNGEPARLVAWIGFGLVIIFGVKELEWNFWEKILCVCTILFFAVALEIISHCDNAFRFKASVWKTILTDILWLIMAVCGVCVCVSTNNNYIMSLGGLAMSAGFVRVMIDLRDCFLRQKYKECVMRAIGKDDKNTAPKMTEK